MPSCIYILGENLEPIISKNIKAVPNLPSIVNLFKRTYTPNSPPVISSNSWHFIHISRDSLIYLSVTHVSDVDANVMLITTYLDQFHLLLKKFLGVSKLNRNMILDNILLIMELFDESLDFGIVQVTEPSIMRDYIRVKVNMPDSSIVGNYKGTSKTDSYIEGVESGSDSDNELKKRTKDHRGKHKLYKFLQRTKQTALSMKDNKNGDDAELADDDNDDSYNSYIAKTTIMPISWRTKGIHYARNEFFLDVVEDVQYLMDFKQGVIRKNLIHGQIFCKSYLSGMPKLKIALNKLLQKDAQFLSYSKFHQCVSLESLSEKEIEFIPPDGDFVLCKYELKRHVKDPPMLKLTSFEVKPKLKKFKVQILLTIETHFKGQNSTSHLNLKVPLSRLFQDYEIELSKPARFKSDAGQVLFNLSDDFLLWEVGSMKGGHGENQLSMTAEFALFNREEYEREQEELNHSMNPPPLREGPKLEQLYMQVHEKDDEKETAIAPQLLTMKFEIPYCTCSGLKVDYLKIEEEQLQYQSFPWVRYKTVSDEEYAYLV